MRPRTEAPRQNDSGLGRVHGVADLSRMDDLAALVEVLRQRGHRHSEGPGHPQRRSLRSSKGEAAHPRLPGGQETTARYERTYSLLCWASWRGQDLARQV